MKEEYKELGALWKRESSNGPYYTGTFDAGNGPIKIVCFANKHKKEEKHPDIRIYESKEETQ
jgi:uncharacterized protein (DUF736 family)